jgi:pantothenate kinase
MEIIGRSNELSFLFQPLIEADDPVYTIISVSGPAGVGKSTLRRHFQNEVRASRSSVEVPQVISRALRCRVTYSQAH